MRRHEWLVGIVTYLLVLAILAWALLTDGQPLLSDTPELRRAEMASAVLYLIMQIYYGTLDILELRRIKRALQGFYISPENFLQNSSRETCVLYPDDFTSIGHSLLRRDRRKSVS